MILLLVVSIAFGGLRLYGLKSLAFQALAHLYVGGLYGAAAGNKSHRVELFVQAVVLTCVEAVCFAADNL